jgi:hypothetical protein
MAGVPLSRRRRLAQISIALIALLGAAAVGQTLHVRHAAMADPDYPSPYDNSKADRVLKAFDANHPKCALWTDWHKLCSRTGPSGSTYCRTDLLHPAEPSTPFCARDFSSPVKDDTPAQLLSRRRFSSWEGSRALYVKRSKYPNNYLYYKDRPFSGNTIYEMEHPYCAVWIYDNGVATAFCAEDGRKGMPSCREHHIRYRVTTGSSFFPTCYEAVKGRACDPYATIPADTPGGEDLFGNPYDENLVSTFHPNGNLSVAGHFCPIESSK